MTVFRITITTYKQNIKKNIYLITFPFMSVQKGNWCQVLAPQKLKGMSTQVGSLYLKLIMTYICVCLYGLLCGL